MNEAFKKILEFIDEQIKIEESIAKSKNEGRPITHQYGANCMNVIKKFVQEVSEEYNGGWIACSERLPEENKDGWTHLILSIKTGEVIFGFWHNEEMGFCKHFRDGVCRVCGVIAWMPLPEQFKERD